MKRVLIIHTDGNTFNNPTLKCVVDLFLENAVSVFIRYPKSKAPTPLIDGVTFLAFGTFWRKLKSFIYNRLNSWTLSFITVYLELYFILGVKYDLIVAVDRLGLVEAARIRKISGTPFVFFSFEIMFEEETSKSFKLLEKKASKFASHWFIQDEIRAECLRKENALTSDNCTLVPLASAGSGVQSSNRLRDRLGIPKDKQVVFLMGTLGAWSMTDDIINIAYKWPDDWVLVVHDRYARTDYYKTEFSGDVQSASSEKVYWSNAATDLVDDMGEILAGVSVGLAFYRPDWKSIYTGRNLAYLGLASGKISTFLRYGIPVITNEIGLYAEMVRRHGFGVVIDTPTPIGETLIGTDWQRKSINARRFFASTLDFKNFENAVWKIFVDVTRKPNESI